MEDIFSFLPEGCISSTIALTTPKDACVASLVSWDFKSASESDTVWERFLPSDYREIISNSFGPPLNYATKKELFFNLCDFPILLDDGKLSFSLSKLSGKKCYMICARELSITWGDTPAYWAWTSIPESRFSEVARLRRVCWLDIKGRMQTRKLSPKTTYAAYLVFRMTGDAQGFGMPTKASVRFAHDLNPVEPEMISSVYLVPRPKEQPTEGRIPQDRNDGWLEILLGEFFNDEGEGEIEMQLLEITRLNWKKGLILEGIELRPKEG